MTSRRNAVGVALLTTTVAALLGAPASQAAPLRCDHKGQTVAVSGTIRVFTNERRRPLNQRDWYACRIPRGRATFIHDGATNEVATPPQIVGDRYVGLASQRDAPVDGIPDRTLRVLDVRTGRFTVEVTNQGLVKPAAQDLATLYDGSWAFIDRGDDTTSDKLIRVQSPEEKFEEIDAAAPGTRLDDLVAARRTLYWRNGSTARLLAYGP